MSRVKEDVWHQLLSEDIARGTTHAKPAEPQVTDRLLAGMDHDRVRYLLIHIDAGSDEVHDNRSRGIRVTTEEMTIAGQEAGKYIVISCQQPAGHEIFSIVGGELATALARAEQTDSVCVESVMSRFRYFWGQIPTTLLSKQRQIGLFGELWFLLQWLAPEMEIEHAVDLWRGQQGARHDFEASNWSVEAKTTTSVRGQVHTVHGIEQLVPPEQGKLYLFALQIREENGASNTLPLLVASCRNKLINLNEASLRFETALASAGYSSEFDLEYSNRKFRIIDEAAYIVEGDFPRLVPEQLKGGVLLEGVDSIKYQISLHGYSHLRVATESAELPFL